MDQAQKADSTIVGPSVVPKLEMIQGESVGKTFRLKFKTRIGREIDNDVVLVDPRVSRYHCQISYENGEWLLADLGSANGTLLNNMPLGTLQPISQGDSLQVGESILVFQDPLAEHIDKPQQVSSPAPDQAQSPSQPNPKPEYIGRLVYIAGGLIVILILAFVALVLWVRNNALTKSEEATLQSDLIETGHTDNTLDLPLKYKDDFSDSNSGWDDASGPYYTKRYGNHQYNIDINTNNLVVWGLANRHTADFKIEVETIKRQGGNNNTYGIIFRFVDTNNYYRFDVSSDGFFHLAKLQQGQWHILVDWTGSGRINKGEDPNHLAVHAFGPQIAVFANEQKLAQVTDDSFQSGNFGFFASSFDDPNIWVSFDNLRLYAPVEEEVVFIPTATALSATRTERQAEISDPQTTDTPSQAVSPEITPTALPESEEETVSASANDTQVSAETADTGEEPQDEPVAHATNEVGSPLSEVEPLPDFVSHDQFRGRGQQALTGKLIFPVYDLTRGTYDIFRANLDGTDQELLVADASQPDMSQDGQRIVYRSWQASQRGLMTRAINETNAWHFVKFFEAASPVFSPDEQFFVFHSRQGGETPGVYRTDGADHEIIRRDGIPVQGEKPAVTPDGRIVYRGCLSNNCGLIITNLDGSGPQQLTPQANDNAPAVSPDGNTLAFMSDRDGNWEIYKIDLTGQNLTRLTTEVPNDGLPAWSPDGNTLVFVADRDGEWGVWAMTPSGEQQRKLFSLNGSIDGIAQIDVEHSFGWLEERIVWTP